MRTPRLRNLLVIAILAAVAAAAAVTVMRAAAGASDADVSWAPAPRKVRGLTVLASAGDGRYALHTKHGDVGFLAGVNLGATTPGHQPGELAIGRSDYRRWFAEMGRLGISTVRVYTIHPPSFYEELARYDREHSDAPLYLLQGVYLPDESYPSKRRGLYDPGVQSAFRAELGDAVAAVHGDLVRSPQRGRASGRWRADVSRWLAAWIVGVEWDPFGVERTDRNAHGAPGVHGRWFRSTRGATPTERWLAANMDHLAALEAARGVSTPIAFANWPTTDPIRHPDEPLGREDLVGVDANHVLPTAAWPGGSFASYHAYPYYPDFQRHEPALRRYVLDGRHDPYAGYLDELRRHHGRLPVMITEFGVPSSIGSGHEGPLGRDQGAHTEQEAMEIDADLLRAIRRERLAGAFLFSWTDEWFKATWNTLPRQTPVADRRQLWHDPWTNEQWFGLVATDAGPPSPKGRVVHESRHGIREIRLATDPAWLHLRLHLDRPAHGILTLGFDVVPGGAPRLPGSPARDDVSDYAVVLPLDGRAGQAYVRPGLDPLPLDYHPLPRGVVRTVDGWNEMLLSTNRALILPTTEARLPYETMDVGRLRRGSWDPSSPAYDRLATWQTAGKDVTIRIPWMQLGIVDPSSRKALVPRLRDGRLVASTVPVRAVGLRVLSSEDGEAQASLTWDGWNAVRATERLKAGASVFARALREVESSRSER
jgi:hypothetical protein